MRVTQFEILAVGAMTVLAAHPSLQAATTPPATPGFSVNHMDKSVAPGDDFYHYADGSWLKSNPVPADKSRWASFTELQERNWFLIHQILDSTASGEAPAGSTMQKVGDFYRSAMDTNRLEKLGLKPLDPDLERIAALKSTEDVLRLLADFHQRGVGGLFGAGAGADAKNSSIYAFHLAQGGLSLPDRDYYLTEAFAKQRAAYQAHVAKMFTMVGESPADAEAHAATVLALETSLATACKPRAELRDPVANYHKFKVADAIHDYPHLAIATYLESSGLGQMPDVIIGQPEFFAALDKMVQERSLTEWQVYLRWHLVNATAPYLNAAAEEEHFQFFNKTLRDQQVQEPRWQRSAHVIDGSIGEALGQLFVEKHFPPAARARMVELVANLKEVVHDRLQKLDWMTEATRVKALAKFDRFTQKIGHPDRFRDYSAVQIKDDDYLGNVRRSEIFESRRQLARIGKPVDKTEWHMSPETVNAYFNPSQNEIVFPAGILQPPFFDPNMDDAVNYGAIGVVIGHEITHGYDDSGRKYDADGNLNDWWTAADAKAFEERAQKVVNQFNAYEPLPGLHVNGKLTLGENIADLGGTSIAFEALQRALAKDPAKPKNIDGFTPEQRFFLSLSQVWRVNCREAELRRLVTVDPHSPGQYRAIGPHVNVPEWYAAFGIKEGDKMWRAPGDRAKIW